MKVTEKQLMLMLRVLEGSLCFTESNDIFGYNNDTRVAVYNQIINQQSDVLIDVKGE